MLSFVKIQLMSKFNGILIGKFNKKVDNPQYFLIILTQILARF